MPLNATFVACYLHFSYSSLLTLSVAGMFFIDYTVNCHDGSDEPSEAALAQCLRDMLELPGRPPVYIALDALDECSNATGSPSPRKKVLDFVKNLVGCKPPNLHVCITSRPEQDVHAALGSLTPTSCRVSLHEEIGQMKDIHSYIRSFVHTDEAMGRWRAEDKEHVICTLSERAGGMCALSSAYFKLAVAHDMG